MELCNSSGTRSHFWFTHPFTQAVHLFCPLNFRGVHKVFTKLFTILSTRSHFTVLVHHGCSRAVHTLLSGRESTHGEESTCTREAAAQREQLPLEHQRSCRSRGTGAASEQRGRQQYRGRGQTAPRHVRKLLTGTPVVGGSLRTTR